MILLDYVPYILCGLLGYFMIMCIIAFKEWLEFKIKIHNMKSSPAEVDERGRNIEEKTMWDD